MPDIHPTALISPDVQLADDVTVGPYAILDGQISLGEGCRVEAHAQLLHHVVAGPRNTFGRACIIGDLPQDLSFNPQTESGVMIGEGNTFREHVTIHRATKAGNFTTVGNQNYLMVNVHLAHDVVMGDSNILANACLLAGHVHFGNRIVVGGNSIFHQFVRIGDGCMLQGASGVGMDLAPYCIHAGINSLAGINLIGLRRAGHSAEVRNEIKELYHLLFRSGMPFSAALEKAKEQEWSEPARSMIEFVSVPSKRGYCLLHRQA